MTKAHLETMPAYYKYSLGGAGFETMDQVDVWLAEKIKAELSDKPDPDWGGCMGMFFGAKDDFPMSMNKAEELFKEAVEYGEHVIETYKIE